MLLLTKDAAASNGDKTQSLLDAPTTFSVLAKTEAGWGESPFPQPIMRVTARLMDDTAAACVASLLLAISATPVFLLVLLNNL